MSKLSGAYYDIHHMEHLANKDQWVNQIHPLVKLVITLFYIMTVVSVQKYDIARTLILGVYPVAVFILGEVSFKDSIKRVRLILPLVCVVGIVNPFFDRQIIATIGSISITSGMLSMITLIIKGVYTVFATYLLIATTTIEKICYAMRLLHIPGILVTQILLTYRYISVLLKEANTIMQAYSLRAPNQKGIQFKVWGSLVGQLLLRSIDRAEDVYASMLLRGYHGEFYSLKEARCGKKDYAFLLIWLLIFGIIRVVL